MKKIVETERIYLRDIFSQDFEALLKLHEDPDVMRYTMSGPLNEIQLNERIKKWSDYNQNHPGMGFWSAIRKSDEQCIGRICLIYLDKTKHIEIGYRLSKLVWNQGYATEIAQALVSYAFQTLELQQLVGVVHPGNFASQRVLEKTGFAFEKMAYHYQTDVKFYTLNAA